MLPDFAAVEEGINAVAESDWKNSFQSGLYI
jgi:hypothetical protein